jgi:hypothetical protein
VSGASTQLIHSISEKQRSLAELSPSGFFYAHSAIKGDKKAT